jgi:L-ribulose-5-phosphate 4-epimerase
MTEVGPGFSPDGPDYGARAGCPQSLSIPPAIFMHLGAPGMHEGLRLASYSDIAGKGKIPDGRDMLKDLKQRVCDANLELVEAGLVIQTFGNASAVDRASGTIVIKPSGVPYAGMKPAHMVAVSLATGRVVEGNLNPSSDTPTHLVLYRAFPGIAGIVHTHSLYATAWAQARREIPALGTTHADYWHGSVPCTRLMKAEEILTDYEANTGQVIVERFRRLDPLAFPAVLVASHGPFTWGDSIEHAVHHAVILEHTAQLASETLRLRPMIKPMQRALLNKHFLRKHGRNAYYGQRETAHPRAKSTQHEKSTSHS